MGTNNFLIEVYFRAEPGRGGGTLVSKSDGQTGYRLALDDEGAPALVLQAGGRTESLRLTAPVNDGAWHHLLAECDRGDARATIYLDGKKEAEGKVKLAPEASLSNGGDFLVGRGPEGDYFAGAVDFLRVCRGTLADARTSIEELYAWEFDGPFLRDFAGQPPAGDRRDAGALEGR
jgi:hypothetical protein